MSLTYGMHKVVFLAALSVLIDNYVSRKSEEKLDFLEKIAAWLTRHVTVLRQQSIAKSVKRRKQTDEEEEEKEDAVVPEVSRQTISHQKPVCKVVSDQTVTKMLPGSDCQHNVSAPMQPQNRQFVATKHGVHQIQDGSTATVVPTRQTVISQADGQIQEEMPAVDQVQDVLAQAMSQGNIPMAVDLSPSELLSEDTGTSAMDLLDSMVLKLGSGVQ